MDSDILIIGGGPAGLSTALYLTQIAPHLTGRILLLEKAQYPRPKLCAGGLTADAETLLELLGLDVSEVPYVDSSVIHFDFGSKGLKLSVPKRHALRVIRRDEFDNWLAKKTRASGIEIRENITVKDVQPDSNSVTVLTDKGEFYTQIVIGADGSNGITRRCVLPNEQIYTARLLEVITPRQPAPLSEKKGEMPWQGRWGQAYFDFLPVPKNIAGYTWDFPTQVKGQAMRCWGIYDSNLQADKKRPPLKGPLREEMARHGFSLDEYKLQGYPIRWFNPANEVSVQRVLLAGDAAGADPLFGEGISIALGYGVLAAREVEHAFRTDDFSFGGYRRRLMRSALGSTLLMRWLVAEIIYRFKWRWFQILLWRVLKPFVIAGAWIFILNWGKRMR